jgi:putative tricarboxylic transport membrane protein
MRLELAAGAGLAFLGIAMGVGALTFRADPSYSGIGPAFYPCVIASVLFVCGVMLIRESLTGGYRNLPEMEEAEPGYLRSFFLISSGLLLTAFLITRIGFPLTCAMLFTLVAYTFGSRRFIANLTAGLVISLLMHWAFAKGLGMSLPSLTAGGWI